MRSTYAVEDVVSVRTTDASDATSLYQGYTTYCSLPRLHPSSHEGRFTVRGTEGSPRKEVAVRNASKRRDNGYVSDSIVVENEETFADEVKGMLQELRTEGPSVLMEWMDFRRF
jgi:hypothetical protein